MEGISWFFLALVVALIALGMVAGLRRRPLGINPARHCSNCRTPMSMRRVSWLRPLPFFAAWECRHCGSRSRSRTGTAA
jgi:hypothetical protein